MKINDIIDTYNSFIKSKGIEGHIVAVYTNKIRMGQYIEHNIELYLYNTSSRYIKTINKILDKNESIEPYLLQYLFSTIDGRKF